MKKLTSFLLSLSMLISLLFIPSIDSNATAAYMYDYAFEVLDLVNAERAKVGLSPLTMDKELLAAANIRGEEITRKFSHDRPDGTECFTASNKMYGENIAYGQRTPSFVMYSWMNSQGHKENILRTGFTSIGISCYMYNNTCYWVQCFGYEEADPIALSDVSTTPTPAKPTLPDSSKDDTDVTVKPGNPSVSYQTHIQTFGWDQGWKSNGESAGTMGYAKRLESIQIKLKDTSSYDLNIEYKTHIQSFGWEQGWSKNGESSGTTGLAKRLEAIQIKLTGSDSNKFDVYYRVHAQSYGWLGWAKNGECSGTAGQAKRLEAIQVVILPKGEAPEGTLGYSYVEYGKTANNNSSAGIVNYSTHVQSYGDQSYVYDGSISGTFGEAKRLEGIKINLNTKALGYTGGIQYMTHVQTYGWDQGYVGNGEFSGTKGEAKRLEAISIYLTGDVADHYDVYYRVHAQTYGWLGWAKNGECSGTAGLAKRLEGIQVVVLPKSSAAPSDEGQPAFISK